MRRWRTGMGRWRTIRPNTATSAHDIFIGGAELAALALESDLVDECHLFLHPVIVVGRNPESQTAIRQNLELLDTRRFGTGAIHLRYRLRGAIGKTAGPTFTTGC